MRCKTIATGLLGIVVICTAVGFLAVWVGGLPGPRHGAYLAIASLHNIYEDLREYDQARGRLPPATALDAESGKESSWRIEVYQTCLHHGAIASPSQDGNASTGYDYRKAWNDPANLRLQDFGARLFSYTQDDVSTERTSGRFGINTTYYKAITGPDTAFDSARQVSLKQLSKNLILVMRVERSDTHWMEPGDLKVEQLRPSEETKGLLLGKDGYVLLFADGKGWVLSGETPISDLCKFFTVTNANQLDREEVLGRYRILP